MAHLFKEIVFHGQGGYDWETIYNMPIWLRRFTFSKIKEHYEERQKKQESNNETPPKIARPGIKPTYSTKASSK